MRNEKSYHIPLETGGKDKDRKENMCYKKPGPRCASGALTALKSKTAALAKADAEVQNAQKQHANNPTAATLKSLNGSVAKRNHIAKERDVAQRDYDGTPKGLKELQASLKNATTKEESSAIRGRITCGKMLRGWRRHQLTIMESNGNGDIRTRRGNFLTAPGLSS